jgi:peptidoglycan/LPS O-acetylase OafA/YrhL
MQIENIAWYFLMIGVFVAEAALLVKVLPRQSTAGTGAADNTRLATLDGLRGILALSVFVHHCVLFHAASLTGKWENHSSAFYAQMGVLPVTLFFFITGYLFWTKLVKRPSLPFGRFIAERLARLGSAYWVACIVFFLLVAISSHFQRRVSLPVLVGQMFGWCSFLAAGHDMNGLPDSRFLFGQVWTLRLEWCFYLTLPLLGWFARRRLRLLLLLGCAAAGSAVFNEFRFVGKAGVPLSFAADYLRFLASVFGVGMLIAILPVNAKGLALARSSTATILSFLFIGGTLAFVPAAYGVQESSWLALPFLCVCLGNSWFGLLQSSPMQLLGRISYSFYLFHAFVLHIGLVLLQRFVPVASLDPVSYWGFAGACGVAAVAISCLSWHWLERPFLHGMARVQRSPQENASSEQLLQVARFTKDDESAQAPSASLVN